ncbi:MAG: phosphodiester glycosidase family protein [Mycobacteriales bacterium]
MATSETVVDAPDPQRARPWYRRRRCLVLLLLALVGAPALWSYTTTMLRPSSLPLGVRSVEWVRSHHGAWLVDTSEHVWFGWLDAPRAHGPAARALPALALPVPPRARRVPGSALPQRVPPVVVPALPGEGVWRATGPQVHGGPPVLVTEFRPEAAYPRTFAYVAWFDHTRTELGFYPGRYEPPSAPVRGPMSVPDDQRSRLLATFNAGFIYSDGHNGSSDNGLTNEPLKDGLATLVGYRDGRVAIITWHGGPDAGPDYAFTRQSLPPVLVDGRLNPALDDSSRWGATLGNKVRVWRTGVGIDRHGNLLFAAADGQTVRSLAQLLRHAGAVTAMQFDINPEWPSLIAYRQDRGLDPVKVVPNWQQTAERYLVPDDRDFFAVYAREPGPVTVPFR